MDTMFKVLVIVVVLLAVIGGFLLVIPQDQAETQTISLAINPFPASVLIFIAEEKGYFAEEGLNVETFKFSSGKLALDSMLAGGADIATTADFPIALAGLSNQEFYVIATIGQGDDIKVIARKDSGISSIQDLQGKIIATKKGGGGELFMIKLFEIEGIPLESVSITYMDPPDLPFAIVRGDIDAFIVWEPHISNAKRELGENAIIFAPKNIYGETWNLAVSKRFAEENPEAVKKFLRALIKAENFYNENREESIEITEKHSGATEEVAIAFFNNFNMEVSFGKILKNQVEEAAQWSIDQKMVTNTEPPNYDKMFKTDFLKELRPESVTID